MSSKRGRKRNDNLPPNRARDVQRAFRARRAAHLQALEQRVAELEEENSCFRQALNLPQANRPLLGKGPTGKDKPKTDYENHHPLHSSRESSTDSPGSMRESESPNLVSATLPPREAVQEIEDGTGPWGQTIVMTEEIPQYQPLSAPPTISTKNPYSPPYPSSRSSSLAPMYMYNATNDRGLPAYQGHFEHQQPQHQQPPQRSYSYSSPHDSEGQQHPFRDSMPTPAPESAPVYPPQRRSTAGDLHMLGGTHYAHIRLPSPPRVLLEPLDLGHGHGHHSQHDPHSHHRPAYTPDGHIIS
ncbi:hypothetical protein B0H16DRAFT_1692649 [Mycena metata]|uniref:BZIP domain-containing protein n=1 Tax=Mycena metata TaxID=1033252 RepID=A0AAD7IN72_9AGAR|nr:hypothetical protein B0H16DRAFT_1692649 [Mycena metata]